MQGGAWSTASLPGRATPPPPPPLHAGRAELQRQVQAPCPGGACGALWPSPVGAPGLPCGFMGCLRDRGLGNDEGKPTPIKLVLC